MRIIGGTYRNRRLSPPAAMDARPTTDFAKEGLFNVLQHNHTLEDIRVLDLFAGTGNISLEFLSRGAGSVLSVEQDRKLVAFMERTAEAWGVDNWRVLRSDVFAFLRTHRSQYDIVFADPPFAMEGIQGIPTLVLEAGILANGGMVIVEHSDKVDLGNVAGHAMTRKYGLVHFSFFTATAPEQAQDQHEP
jgi:16S rRNA (guanine(966)-N(2))-methyltransferase RsmD